MSVQFPEERQDNTDNRRLDLEKKMNSEGSYWSCWKSITELLLLTDYKGQQKIKIAYWSANSNYLYVSKYFIVKLFPVSMLSCIDVGKPGG